MWATEVDDEDYSWENTLPYFRKSATITQPTSLSEEMMPLYDVSAFETAHNSDDRPLQICYPDYLQPFNPHILRAFKSLGFEDNDKLNSGVLNGVSMCPLSFDSVDSTRSSSEAAFLQPALGRANLKVYAHTNAQRILFDQSDSRRAVGVSVNTAGIEYVLHAQKEIILSAGAVSSLTNSLDSLSVY